MLPFHTVRKIGYFLDEYLVLRKFLTLKHLFWIDKFKYLILVSRKFSHVQNTRINFGKLLQTLTEPSNSCQIGVVSAISCKVMVDLMFFQRTKTNSELVYTFNFIWETNRKLFTFFWMDEYLRMSDLKESRDLFCLSPDFNKLSQENEQLGKNVFM